MSLRRYYLDGVRVGVNDRNRNRGPRLISPAPDPADAEWNRGYRAGYGLRTLHRGGD